MKKIKTRRLGSPSAAERVSHLVFLLLSAVCVLPMLLVVIVSFSSAQSLVDVGYSLFPTEWSTGAYEFLFKDLTQLLRAYGVTAFITVVGTGLGMILSTMLAYALSRKGFRLRTAISFYVFFTRGILLGRGANNANYAYDVFWTRDQNIEYARLLKNIQNAAKSGNLELLTSEQQRSVREWQTVVELADMLCRDNPNTGYIQTTCRYGCILFRLYEAMYRANVYAFLGGHAGDVSEAVRNYDDLWEQWQTLYETELGCPSLYAKDSSPIDLIGYDWNSGFDAAIDPLRDLDADGRVKIQNMTVPAADNDWGLTGAACN